MDLFQLFQAARNASPVSARQPAGFNEPLHFLPTSTQQQSTLRLDQSLQNLASYFTADGELRRIPEARPAVTEALIDPLTAARAHSRVAQAGAALLLRDPHIQPQPTGLRGDVVLSRQVSGITVIKPLTLRPVADGAPIPDQTALPFRQASVDWAEEGATPLYGARLVLSRADFRDRLHNGTLEQSLLASILAGIGAMADQALLTALSGANLPEFSLAAAAAAGLPFNSLRALVGTAGAGASVADDGTLRAARVLAELTDATAGTYVGAFNSVAVMLDHEARVIVDRGATNGSLVVTVYGSAAALIPDPSKFWRVVA
ncbi:hypothetical protein M3O40_17560 [Xanthomonas nasturtii]|uniref:hypothetical protein n=1 Tax=Xanthomonas nasturtii TaxID=1843581 RepID=UPI002012D6F5|nr:hypothetical protein [Xanthomonas nasturtii]MCL1500776.1 hypothetical protein [Xanthomonas nasturtii]MCL1504877.1 hypothetical protein [Xanthomonas nasturtii]